MFFKQENMKAQYQGLPVPQRGKLVGEAWKGITYFPIYALWSLRVPDTKPALEHKFFWHFWVLITLTSTLNPICPVLRYPCGKQFFSTEYPSNEIYFPDKKPYSGDFQYKKSHFGKKWPKIDQNCEKKRGFYHCKHSFSPEWSISINKIPL